ncbi:hypothetical protein HMSSN036_70100 [Paenibacillus macerans]|nr:hypothetical protein HMSSN036_70100 [Paenibacillus macerans]
MLTGEPAERLTGENQGYAMCMEVPGIDVLITGHQHRLIAAEAGGVTVIQPGSNGQALGKISVCLQKSTDGAWAIREKKAELLIPDETTEADGKVLDLVRGLEVETQNWLDQPIGEVSGDMEIRSPLACRLADHPFMEFVNKVQMEAAGVGVSNAALLSNASKGFRGSITMRDVLTNFMYPNTLAVLRLKGKDIREALEQTANYFTVGEDGEIAVNPAYVEPKEQHYNYDMWEGIEYVLDVSRPPGARGAAELRRRTLAGRRGGRCGDEQLPRRRGRGLRHVPGQTGSHRNPDRHGRTRGGIYPGARHHYGGLRS